jgi:Zn-dependent peptidase ImmA (M78 family)
MMAAIQTRFQFGIGPNEPLCIYELCHKLGIKVRFVDINVEGMYRRGADPRIMVAARRPVARRAFTCAHELGHHIFGHGSTVDELEEERSKDDSERPEEILANSFAAFTLMPTVGVRQAFASRRLAPNKATPTQIFTVACNFGVGYATLLNHLAYGINDLSPGRAVELLRSAKTLDIEVGAHLLLPKSVTVAEGVVEPIADYGSQVLNRAVATGIRRAHGPSGWATFIRVCREKYVGMAAYRHLEDNDDEDDE